MPEEGSTPHDGNREPAVGSAADPRRIGQARNYGFGADRLSAASATPSPAVTDLADVSDQSCRHAGVDGFLHGLDPHGPGPSLKKDSPTSVLVLLAHQHPGADGRARGRVLGSGRITSSLRTTRRVISRPTVESVSTPSTCVHGAARSCASLIGREYRVRHGIRAGRFGGVTRRFVWSRSRPCSAAALRQFWRRTGVGAELHFVVQARRDRFPGS